MSSILRIEGLSKGYINKKALDDISIEIERGKIVGVLGPNGSGKTTLIKLITGLIKPTSGKVFIDEHEPDVYTKSRSEEHTFELQSRQYLVCRLLLEKK